MHRSTLPAAAVRERSTYIDGAKHDVAARGLNAELVPEILGFF